MAAVRRPVLVQSPFRRLEELWRRGCAGKLAKREGETARGGVQNSLHAPLNSPSSPPNTATDAWGRIQALTAL